MFCLHVLQRRVLILHVRICIDTQRGTMPEKLGCPVCVSPEGTAEVKPGLRKLRRVRLTRACPGEAGLCSKATNKPGRPQVSTK